MSEQPEYDWAPIKRAARIEQEKFSIGWHAGGDGSYEIIYDGRLFATIYAGDGPEGFTARAVEHFFDMLIGRRTALWDEQVIYSEYPRDKAHAQLNGRRMADHLMKQAEQRWQEMDDKRNSIARVTTQEQPAIEAMRTALTLIAAGDGDYLSMPEREAKKLARDALQTS